LISADATGVTFKYGDYRIQGPDRYKAMTLEPPITAISVFSLPQPSAGDTAHVHSPPLRAMHHGK